VLLPRENLAAHLPQDVSDDFQSIPIANSAELLAALDGGHDAWRAYRDQVLNDSSSNTPRDYFTLGVTVCPFSSIRWRLFCAQMYSICSQVRSRRKV
jgi:hypothetical protein